MTRRGLEMGRFCYPRTDGRGWILLALGGGWFLSIGVRMIYPVLLPHFRSAFDIDLSTAGLLISVLFVAYGLGQAPAGMFADRIGKGTVMTFSMVLSAGAIIMVVAAGSSLTLFGATILFGFSVSLFTISQISAMSDLFPESVGTTVGLTRAAGDVGNTILPPTAGILASVAAWQIGFAFTVPLFLCVAVGIWLAVPSRTTSVKGTDPLSRDALRYLGSILLRPDILRVTIMLILGLSVLTAFVGLYPTYLAEEKELSAPSVGIVFGTFFAFGILVKPLAGNGFDRFGIRRAMGAITTTTACGMAALPFVETVWILLLVTAVTSTALGIGTVGESYLIGQLPDDIQGSGLGVLRSGYTTLGAVSPALFGMVADRGFFDEGFFVLAVGALAIVVLTFGMPDGRN